ncbi:MAG: hypothetical protein OXF20_08630 [Gammaproteobacteria bacterium]|nr:hypothetical protein [Gammaproteobacteria bacterium]
MLGGWLQRVGRSRPSRDVLQEVNRRVLEAALMAGQVVCHARQRVLKAVPSSLACSVKPSGGCAPAGSPDLPFLPDPLGACRKRPRIRSPGIRHQARKHDPPPRSGMETGAAMPRIQPSGQIRNTPAPRPTESRPGADKKISIYGLGLKFKID